MLTIEEAKDMVKSGDIDLNEYRDFYVKTYHVVCSLTDDEMIEVIRQAEDDMDPEDWAALFKHAEQNK